jgi:hypothetical protein
MEIVVDKALRVQLGPQGYSAKTVLTTDGKLLVKKIIQRALNMVHTIQYNWDAFLH